MSTAAAATVSAMSLAGPAELTRDAVAFWRRQLSAFPGDLEGWLGDRVSEVQFLWGHVVRMNGSQGMWKELTESLEERDPTNAWTRHYDGIYFESQVLHITRLVRAGQRTAAEQHPSSLGLLLRAFATRQELLGPITGPFAAESLNVHADPLADLGQLEQMISDLMDLGNRTVAHIDIGEPVPSIEWNDLEEATEAVTSTFERYSLRLTGVNYKVRYEDTPWRDWQSVFREPVFKVRLGLDASELE